MIKIKISFAGLMFFFLSMAQALPSHEDIFKSNHSQIKQFLTSSKPLNSSELRQLVTNNTLIGHTSHSRSIYELFFKDNGNVIFRKSRHNDEIYLGKWWIKNNEIYSIWKTYAKKATINRLRYYHLIDNIYVAYNVNDACGAKNQFCNAFMVFHGDPFLLSRSEH